MEKSKIKISIMGILLMLVSVLFLIGINICFPVCKGMSETVMSCHWAGEAVRASAVLLTVLSVVHLCGISAQFKAGLDIAFIGIAVLTLRLPGGIIRICEGGDMACRAKTLPGTIIFSVLIIVLSAADIFLCLKEDKDRKHRRPDAELKETT